MDGQAIVENYRQMVDEPEFSSLNINQLRLHHAKYIIRLLEPVIEFKLTEDSTLKILKKNKGITEYITIDEYRHYIAFTLVPEINVFSEKHQEASQSDYSEQNIFQDNVSSVINARGQRSQTLVDKSFEKVKPILEDLFPEMDLTVDPRKMCESWITFYKGHRPDFLSLLLRLYNVSFDIPEEAIISYLKGVDHSNWEITSGDD